MEEFDDNSRRILKNTKSKLDGLSAAAWLTADNDQDRRKAALLNILAELDAVPVAKKNESLSRFVKHVFHAEVNLIYCALRALRIRRCSWRSDDLAWIWSEGFSMRTPG